MAEPPTVLTQPIVVKPEQNVKPDTDMSTAGTTHAGVKRQHDTAAHTNGNGSSSSTAVNKKEAVSDSDSDDSDDDDSDDDVPLMQIAKQKNLPLPTSNSKPAVSKPSKPSVPTVSVSKAAKTIVTTKLAKKAKVKAESDDDQNSDVDDDDEDDDTKARFSTTELFDADNYEAQQHVKPLIPQQGANKWWNRPVSDIKWQTLQHNGVVFPPAHVRHNVPLYYDGQPVELTVEQEEVATFYAKILESEHVKKDVFNRNFFGEFRQMLGKGHVIKQFDKLDFTHIHRHLVAEREAKKQQKKIKALKEKEKEEKQLLTDTYGYALVDGYKEKVGNFTVELPGLFLGRGAHPKTGRIKQRIQPEDITINIGRGEKIPPCPPGHKWRGIVHNQHVTWLAYWVDNINENGKYMMLAASSRFKGESDIKKYTKAQNLKNVIDQIRQSYTRDLQSTKSAFKRQRGVALYLIDRLALRVGNEKNTEEEADTVGCCSLRKEHLSFPTQSQYAVTFDFLGKDSMRYYNTVEVDKHVHANLKEFCANCSKPTDQIFDKLDVSSLNDHLKELMPGLSAKVFRTYNASITLQDELHKTDVSKDIISQRLVYYNKANRTVAILCNHQKTVSKGHEGQMEKLNDAYDALVDERAELQEHIDKLNGVKLSKAERESRAQESTERGVRHKERMNRKIIELSDKKEKELRDQIDPKLSDNEVVTQLKEHMKQQREKLYKERKLTSDLSQCENKLVKLEERIENARSKITLKDDSKTVALGTSKINYMDPRITVAWCKTVDVPVEKIFSRTLLQKFPWAMEVPSTWRF